MRTYARGVPDGAVFINRTMEECARSYPGRRVRAVDQETGRWSISGRSPRSAPPE